MKIMNTQKLNLCNDVAKTIRFDFFIFILILTARRCCKPFMSQAG